VTGQALDAPLDGRSLEERCRGRRTAVVVVPDATRASRLPEILPAVVSRLERGGIRTGDVTVLIATGTHPPSGPVAARQLTGALPDGVRVVEHACRDTATLATAGVLATGLEVRLARLALEADLLLTVGSVRHHYFAGFGGGPKMIFPGVAGYREIQANHARVVDSQAGGVLRRHPRCEPGVLDGNPVAEEIALAAELRTPP
jgi:nickel-dependent lactate racemase